MFDIGKKRRFATALVKKGGNKRGFIEAERTLDPNTIKTIKEAWQNLYSNNTDNVVVLNSGVKFHESSNSAVEMQLNENKSSNANEIFKLFGFPHTILDGGASESDEKQFNNAVINIITTIETALDRDYLRESEKSLFYWAFDTRELTRGNIKDRYDAYAVALKEHILQLDEVRQLEDLKPLDFNYMKLGLADVLLDIKNKKIYTPNTNQLTDLSLAPVNEERAGNPYHDKKGRFDDAPAKNKNVDKISESGKIKSSEKTEVSVTGANVFKKGFSKKNLDEHWTGKSAHKDQYPEYNKQQYAERALELIQMPVGGNILGYKTKNNEVARYDKASNDYVKGNPNIGIKTMFKPTNKEEYYYKWEKKESFKE